MTVNRYDAKARFLQRADGILVVDPRDPRHRLSDIDFANDGPSKKIFPDQQIFANRVLNIVESLLLGHTL